MRQKSNFFLKQKVSNEVLYFDSLRKKRKPETDVQSIHKSSLFSCRNKYQSLWKTIISAAINIVEPPWWPLTK